MKITVIQFSPSGNTAKISAMIKSELEKRGQIVQLIDITRKEEIFIDKDIRGFLNSQIKPHDVLLIGAPVYAHHLQYHMQDIIKSLPNPNEIWGKYAASFVTYGGISSGVALKEAGLLLNKSGRIVHAGLKVSASHRMTRAFLDKEFNANKLFESNMSEISEFADRILQLESGIIKENSVRSFNYNGKITALKAKLIFNEKEWHKKRYPTVSIDKEKCSGCGLCVKNCPVLHLSKIGSEIVKNYQSDCIHCLNCVTKCPSNAAVLQGDLEKGKAFMEMMIAKKGNKEQPETAVYPDLQKKFLSEESVISNLIYKKMFAGLDSDTRKEKHNPAELLKATGIQQAESILEVGCGSGFFTAASAKLINKNCNYIAIDVHPAAILETSKKIKLFANNAITVQHRDALNTKLPDKQFDLILLFGVIPSPFLPIEKLMVEMNRLIRAGGELAVWTIDKFWNPDKISDTGLFHYKALNNGVHIFKKSEN